MITQTEILENARKLIDTPEKWTKGYLATTKDGEHQRCLQGAMNDAWDGNGIAECIVWGGAHAKLSSVVRQIKRPDGETFLHVAQFNDARETTHEKVVEALDTAISMAKSEK